MSWLDRLLRWRDERTCQRKGHDPARMYTGSGPGDETWMCTVCIRCATTLERNAEL